MTGEFFILTWRLHLRSKAVNSPGVWSVWRFQLEEIAQRKVLNQVGAHHLGRRDFKSPYTPYTINGNVFSQR